MLWEMLRSLVLYVSLIIVACSILTVIGAIILGGFNEHQLTKPKPQNPTTKATNYPNSK